jgi:hypothetical protein
MLITAKSVVMKYAILFVFVCLVIQTRLTAEVWYSAPLQAEELIFGNSLKWASIWEINVEQFIIEKSTDGTSFEEIGTLAAAGFSNVDKSYHFLDVNQTEDLSFYRLKEISAGGKYSYSHVTMVERQLKNDLLLLSMSNLNVSKTFTAKFDAVADLTVTVTLKNFSGQTIDKFEKTMKNGINDIAIEMEQRKPGFYFLSVENGDEKEKFTLQKVITGETITTPVADTRKNNAKN